MSAEKKVQGDLFAARDDRARAGTARRSPTHASQPAPAKHPNEWAGALTPDRRRLRARLYPLVLTVGYDHPEGFMLSQVRARAVADGIMTGHEGAPDPNTGRLMKPRELAWLGALLPRLERLGVVEKLVLGGRVQFGFSGGERAHGNKNVIWQLTAMGKLMAWWLIGPTPTVHTFAAAFERAAGFTLEDDSG